MNIDFTHSKTYRYEIIKASPNAKKVLYVLHGYGQLVKFFIRKFNHLPEDVMIVAPEGMHRFYLKNTAGRVGASWMTKEARESDIADNISYLNELDKQISKQHPIEKRILLGFSQGGATAARWEALGETKIDEMILWSCVFPPDLEMIQSSGKVKNPYFVIGTEDELYSSNEQIKLIEFYKQRGFKTKQYIGKHDIDNETLNEIIRQMN